MPGDQELVELAPHMDGTPLGEEEEDEIEPSQRPSLEEVRAGFMLLDL